MVSEGCEGGTDESAREPPHHFALKWDGSKKLSTLIALDDKAASSALKKQKKHKAGPPRPYTGDDSGEWVPILAVECRGLEPYKFEPMKDEFVIMASSGSGDGGGGGGTIFDEDIELGDGEWADYDGEADVPVSLTEIEFKFEAV